jgi:hypothetical protein
MYKTLLASLCLLQAATVAANAQSSDAVLDRVPCAPASGFDGSRYRAAVLNGIGHSERGGLSLEFGRDCAT